MQGPVVPCYVAPMSDWTIWNNPRCSKSRQTLQLLRERSIEPTVIPYLEAPCAALPWRRLD